VGLGLVAELLVRTTIETSEIYSVRATRGLDSPSVAREIDRTPAAGTGSALTRPAPAPDAPKSPAAAGR
jgi:hypothetical protein